MIASFSGSWRDHDHADPRPTICVPGSRRSPSRRRRSHGWTRRPARSGAGRHRPVRGLVRLGGRPHRVGGHALASRRADVLRPNPRGRADPVFNLARSAKRREVGIDRRVLDRRSDAAELALSRGSCRRLLFQYGRRRYGLIQIPDDPGTRLSIQSRPARHGKRRSSSARARTAESP